MFSTWDGYREHAGWLRTPQKARHQDPHARFVANVDRMFYAAAAAFAVSLVTLLVV